MEIQLPSHLNKAWLKDTGVDCFETSPCHGPRESVPPNVHFAKNIQLHPHIGCTSLN